MVGWLASAHPPVPRHRTGDDDEHLGAGVVAIHEEVGERPVGIAPHDAAAGGGGGGGRGGVAVVPVRRDGEAEARVEHHDREKEHGQHKVQRVAHGGVHQAQWPRGHKAAHAQQVSWRRHLRT